MLKWFNASLFRQLPPSPSGGRSIEEMQALSVETCKTFCCDHHHIRLLGFLRQLFFLYELLWGGRRELIHSVGGSYFYLWFFAEKERLLCSGRVAAVSSRVVQDQVTNGHSTNNARRILFWRERESWSSSSCTRTKLRPGKGLQPRKWSEETVGFPAASSPKPLLWKYRDTYIPRQTRRRRRSNKSNNTERENRTRLSLSLSLCASASEEACCASKQASCTSGDRNPFHKTFRKQQKQQQQ